MHTENYMKTETKIHIQPQTAKPNKNEKPKHKPN